MTMLKTLTAATALTAMLAAIPAMAQSIYGDGHDYGYDMARSYGEANQRAYEQDQTRIQLDAVRREQQRLQDEIDLRDTLSRSQNPWGPR